MARVAQILLLATACRVALPGESYFARSNHKPAPWDVCSLDNFDYETEDPNNACRAGGSSERLEYWLNPRAWKTAEIDQFALKPQELGLLQPMLTEVGTLGPARVFNVHYSLESQPYGEIMLIERGAGNLVPLMIWIGISGPGQTLPQPVIYKPEGIEVLAIGANFGGAMVPIDCNWAWVWTSNGPLLLEVQDAMKSAIDKVAPDYAWYGDNLDWNTVTAQTFPWKEPDGRRGGPIVTTKYAIRDGKIVPIWAEFRNEFDDSIPVRRWP